MPVLVTGIHSFVAAQQDVGARDEREHDGEGKRSVRVAWALGRIAGTSPAMTMKVLRRRCGTSRLARIGVRNPSIR
jgi:hypothetical protein